MRKSFFLFGLVIALVAAHSALSLKLSESFDFPENKKTVSLSDEITVPITLRPEMPKPEKQKEIKKTIAKANIDLFIVVDDLKFLDDKEEAVKEIYSQDEEVVEEVFWYALDRKPIYNGCESLESDEEKFRCFQQKLNLHVRDNFKANNNTMGFQMHEKMMIRFEIDQDGFVSDVKIARGEDADKKQLESIIKSLPQFTPGMYNGKYVKTSYVLPVVLRN